MKRLLILLLVLMTAGLVACKGAVTETPNPCPGGSCGVTQPVGGGGDDGGGNDPNSPTGEAPACDDAAAALLSYANAAYGVSVGYPSCWSAEERAAGNAADGVAAQALFSRASADCPANPTVEVTIGRLKSGESLISLAEAGGCDAGAVSVGALSGSYCDLLTGADRQNGIALRERYALARGGATYVVVSAVACEGEVAGIERILENIAIP